MTWELARISRRGASRFLHLTNPDCFRALDFGSDASERACGDCAGSLRR